MHVQRASSVLQTLAPSPFDVRFERYAVAGPRGVPAWVVRQAIGGDIDGEATWTIPQHHGRRLIRGLRNSPFGQNDITPIEREGLLEVGHVVIDGFLEGLTTSLGLRLNAAIPTLRKVDDRGASKQLGPGIHVTLSQSVDQDCSESRLSLVWSGASMAPFHRALALYVTPFLSPAFGGSRLRCPA